MLDMSKKCPPAVTLRGSLFTLSVLLLNTLDLAEIERELKLLVHQAPKFFSQAPVVIDLQKLIHSSDDIPFESLLKHLRESGLLPVGVRGGTQAQHTLAKAHNLAILSLAKRAEPTLATRPTATPDVATNNRETTPTSVQNVMIKKSVRSGQQYYAQGCDLIVVGPVSQGAELVADGNIHVYGPLRGRALAGVNGNTQARIFCQSLEAELVSVAGRYVVSESLIRSKRNTPHQVFLEDETLKVIALA